MVESRDDVIRESVLIVKGGLESLGLVGINVIILLQKIMLYYHLLLGSGHGLLHLFGMSLDD